jgi:hypothetical protein
MTSWAGFVWLVGTIEVLVVIVLFSSKPTQTWDRKEKISALALVLNLLAFLGAAVGVSIAYGAYDQTRRQVATAEAQLEVARAEQRAWIEISKPTIADDIVFDENGARISVSFEITNVGKSPAFGADPWVSAFFRGLPGGPNGLYQRPTSSRRLPTETIMFPNRPVAIVATGYVSKLQLTEIMRTAKGLFYPSIEICVIYRLSSSLDEHKTCHALLLVRTVGSLLQLSVPPTTIGKDEAKLVFQGSLESIAY